MKLLPAPPRRKRDMEDNVLPLINIVFLLLIFFMVAGVIRPQAPFPLSPPNTAHADAAARSNNILALSADGEMAMAGKTISRAELIAWLEHNHDAGTPLWVKADGQLSATSFTRLLPELSAVGISEVRLLTTPAP